MLTQEIAAAGDRDPGYISLSGAFTASSESVPSIEMGGLRKTVGGHLIFSGEKLATPPRIGDLLTVEWLSLTKDQTWLI
jgi:hypothetical protein